MKRYLSIVLDEKCLVSKTIIDGDSFKLDEYVSKRYNNSEEIRNEYDFIVDEFLERNKQMIENIEKKNNKKYRGQIVILEVLNDGSLKRVKVLYKNDMEKIKNEILNNQNIMREYIRTHKKYFSDYVVYKSRRVLSKTDYEHMISEWRKSVKDNKTYYDICRSILKFVENKEKRKLEENEMNEVIEIIKEERFNVNNDIDDSYDPDYDFHPDLDDIARGKYTESYDQIIVKQDDEEDEVPPKVKVKKLEITGQISFFD